MSATDTHSGDSRATLASGDTQTRPPIYRDAIIVKWFSQLVLLAVVLFALWFFYTEAGDNLATKNISTSYDFLSTNPGFVVSEGIDIEPDTGGRALWVGMVNTFRIAGVGILLATILGIFVGLARLSKNWIVNKVGTVFVEVMRNIPLLVFMILMSVVIGSISRGTEEKWPISGVLHISNKGFSIPRLSLGSGFYQWAVVVLLGLIAARFVRKYRQSYQDRTGNPGYMLLAALATVGVFALVGLAIHPLFGFLRGPLQWISDTIGGVTETSGGGRKSIVQIGLTVAALGLGIRWIKNFLDDRRTPAGLAKLNDDDIYSVIFAGFASLLAVAVVWRFWPGLSAWIVNSTGDLFAVAADKFDTIETFTEEGELITKTRGGGPFAWDWPTVPEGRFANFGPEGWNMNKGFAIVLFSVWFNTAAFIGEIVRGGILAVAKGQTEAAAALGLKRSQQLRQVILPQAFRVVLPPLGNQYLNLTKNTAIAFIVGFSDMFAIGQTLANQTGRVIPVLVISMLFYLACSLTISAFVNTWNARLRIIER